MVLGNILAVLCLMLPTPDMQGLAYITGGLSITPLPTQQHVLQNDSSMPQAAQSHASALTGGGACLMRFEELCGRPVAAADYIALATKFHTLALDGIPVFTGTATILSRVV